jgi:hypothetical protein
MIAAGPLILIFCAIGLIFLFRRSGSTSWRALAVATSVFFVVYVLNRSNFYYVAPAIPILIAAGGRAIELLTEGPRRNWIRYAVAGVIAVSAIVKLPLGIPLLPVDFYVRYEQTLMGSAAAGNIRTDKTQSTIVPIHFGRRFGNRELVQSIASIYHTLPDSDRTQCGILTINYVFASTSDYYRSDLDLPPAISGHNNYWIWGPGTYTGKVMIAVGSSGSHWRQFFEHVERVATFELPFEGKDNRNVNIFVCHDSHEPLQRLWPRLKVYR